MASSAQFLVTGTSVQITSSYGEHRDIYIHNISNHAIFVGGSNVTITNGLQIDKGAVINIRIVPKSTLWAVCDPSNSGTVTVLYQTP